MKATLSIDSKAYVIIAIFVVALLFVISPDSCTHDLFDRTDSAIFFMSGKSWMNGMVPYVDFTDAKGPLLWLIYGAGYVLSKTDYIGVFWISCLFVIASYLLTFKVSCIFLSVRRSLIITLLMTLVYFNPVINYEIRCEDFCMPFILLALYRTCLHLYQDSKSFYLSSFLLGLSIGVTAMMKYSMAIDMCVFVPFVLYACHKDGYSVCRCLLYAMLGFLLPTVPFAVYFIHIGHFNDFINGYFLFPLHTVGKYGGGMFRGIYFRLTMNAETLAWLLSSAVTPLLIPYMKRYHWFPLIASSWFSLVTFHNAIYPYYYSCCAPFMIFLPVALLWMFSSISHDNIPLRYHKSIAEASVFIVIFVLTVFKNLGYYYYNQQSGDREQHLKNMFFQNDGTNVWRVAYHKYADKMCERRKPKVLYLNSLERHGFEMQAQGLPACKYWFFPNGGDARILEQQKDICRKGIPDYVFVTNEDEVDKSFLESLGYHRFYCEDIDFTMYINAKSFRRVSL